MAGTPFPEINWYKHNIPLTENDGCKFEILSDGTCCLILDKAKISDQGEYRCEAKNNSGVITSDALLTIECMFLFLMLKYLFNF